MFWIVSGQSFYLFTYLHMFVYIFNTSIYTRPKYLTRTAKWDDILIYVHGKVYHYMQLKIVVQRSKYLCWMNFWHLCDDCWSLLREIHLLSESMQDWSSQYSRESSLIALGWMAYIWNDRSLKDSFYLLLDHIFLDQLLLEVLYWSCLVPGQRRNVSFTRDISSFEFNVEQSSI